MSKHIEVVELRRYGVRGKNRLSERTALEECRGDFMRQFQGILPLQLRVSPSAYNSLRAFAERWEYPFGYDVKVDYDMAEDEWMLCNEGQIIKSVSLG